MTRNEPCYVERGQEVDKKYADRGADAENDEEAPDRPFARNGNVLYNRRAAWRAHLDLFENKRMFADFAFPALRYVEPFEKTFFVHVRGGSRTLAKRLAAVFEADATRAHCVRMSSINTIWL